MQKALKADLDNLKELNEHFEDGWKFVAGVPTPQSIGVSRDSYTKMTPPLCLVILENDTPVEE